MVEAVAPAPSTLGVNFPAKLECLFRKSRYKILYGGRGGAKSWGAGRALLIKGSQEPLRVLCVREFQKSIGDSVHQLLKEQIDELNLHNFYEVQNTTIIGKNGTVFIFEGIAHNVSKIKSYEGVDICWAEEAHKISENSWNVLVPTIRKENSEIWITFNPELETDSTYQRFIKKTPSNAIKVKMSWRDNPWFPEVLRQEKDDLLARDPDAYMNVWEGECKIITEGAVYAAELREANLQGRIGPVPYDPSVPVEVFFDLGWADTMTLWFRQKAGFEWHYIEYFEDRQKPLDYYLRFIKSRPYVYSSIWLPHDAKAKELGTGLSIEEQTRRKMAGIPVRRVKMLKVEDGINAGRTIFPNCWFDKELCEKGIAALRAYRYEVVQNGQTLSKVPVHDWASHGADSFRYSAVAVKQPQSERLELSREKQRKLVPILDLGNFSNSGVGWMS